MEPLTIERLRYNIQCKNVAKQWNFLIQKLKAMGTVYDYVEEPWRVIAESNGIVKRYLAHKSALDSFDVYLVKAGFDVALQFDKIELACDFLTFMPAPSARDVSEFLHGISQAFRWGTWAIDGARVEKWLSCARRAISACPDWDKLEPGRRFNCHEILMGRVIKIGASLEGKLRMQYLANLSGQAEDVDIEETFGAESRAISVGAGELTKEDLGNRLCRSARRANCPVAVASFYVAPHFLSYHLEAAGPSSKKSEVASSSLPIPGLAATLDLILQKRNSFDFEDVLPKELGDMVGWPLQLRQLFLDLLKTLKLGGSEGPSYFLMTVNMPYQGLPWQHLLADAMNFAPTYPLASILPVFGT